MLMRALLRKYATPPPPRMMRIATTTTAATLSGHLTHVVARL
jgi:hypothetical protein